MAELTDSTVAKLVETMAALNANSQSAAQTSQQINQSIADLLAKMSQQTTSQAAQVLQEETGMGERAQLDNADRSGLLFANAKRTYDEFQQESLECIRRARTHADKLLSDAQVLTNQLMQNAIESANMVSKQAVRHGDVAIDHQWNVDEQGYQVEAILGNQTFKEGIRAAVVSAVNDALAAQPAKK